MHLKKRFPFNESNVIKKKLQKTGKYMYGRQVDIKKKYVSAMLIFLRDVGCAFLYSKVFLALLLTKAKRWY